MIGEQELSVKPCSRCKSILPLSDFYPHRRMKLGRQSHCKKCARQWHHERPDYVRKKNAEWHANNREYKRDKQRIRNYGFTPQDANQLRKLQEGKCACCHAMLNDVKECVDHCHVSGRIRGLLCNRCNVVLGWVEDDPALLKSMAFYLTKEEAEAW